jgi:hypothetical protein
LTALAGFAFVVLSAGAAVLLGDAPGAAASATEVADYFDDEHARVAASVCVEGLSLACFVWFLAGLAWRLHSGGAPMRARVAYGAGLVATGLFAQAAVVLGALAFRATDDASVAQSLFDISLVSQNIAAFPIAALVTAAAPRSVGLLLGAFFLVDGVTFAGEGFFAPDGEYSRVGFLLLLIWVAWTGARTWSSSRPGT